ncbi:hypothetical protein D3C75_976670 [compost metagenome]
MCHAVVQCTGPAAVVLDDVGDRGVFEQLSHIEARDQFSQAAAQNGAVADDKYSFAGMPCRNFLDGPAASLLARFVAFQPHVHALPSAAPALHTFIFCGAFNQTAVHLANPRYLPRNRNTEPLRDHLRCLYRSQQIA